MSEQKEHTFKNLIESPEVQEKFFRILGENGEPFLISVLNLVNSDEKLKVCDPNSILSASEVAGTLNLPLDPSLGMAFIVRVKKTKQVQFQIGYRGLIELGHRSQQFRGLNASDVREGEFKGVDRMTGRLDFDWIQDNDERKKFPVIGWVGYFELVNGFSKALYMTEAEMTKHGSKYSSTYNLKNSQWSANRSGMAKKTVLKLVLDKFAPKSVEMVKAIKSDQAVIEQDGSLNYVDNPTNIDVNKLRESQLEEIKLLLKIEGLIISEDEKINIGRIVEKKEFESYKKVIKILNERIPKIKN